MPRKTKTTIEMAGDTKVKSKPKIQTPSQGEIARLIQDSFELFSSELLTKLIETKKYSNDDLTQLRIQILSAKSSVQNRTIDQLIKYY